jgi:hypothetical protein
MQARPQSVRRSTWRCRLYLDDLQAIFDILKDGGHDVEIRVPGYTTTKGPDDLLTLGNTVLRDVQVIRARPVYISVDLNGDHASVRGLEDDSETVGVVTKIADIIRARLRWASLVVFGPISMMVLILGSLTAALAFSASLAPKQPFSTVQATVLLVFLGLIIVQVPTTIWLASHRHSIVICARRNDAPNFWQRNRESITVNTIIAVVAAAVGAGLTKLFG